MKNDENCPNLHLDAKPGTYAWDLENRLCWKLAANGEEMKKKLLTVETLRDAVDILRRAHQMSWQKLAWEIGIARQTLMGWLEGKSIRFSQVVSICVALHLRGDLGSMLVRISECRTRSVPKREIYWFMVEMAGSLTIERCNEILALEKLPPLHYGEFAA